MKLYPHFDHIIIYRDSRFVFFYLIHLLTRTCHCAPQVRGGAAIPNYDCNVNQHQG